MTRFDERTLAQMAAYLLALRGGRMSVLKLMKLLYLAERQAIQWHGFPISFDRMVNMPHGPVLSGALDFVSGFVASGEGGWEAWISDREGHEVALRKEVERDDLDHLSDAEIEVLNYVFQRFGRMTRWEIREYTHELPEWHDPNGSSTPLRYEDVMRAVGFDDDHIRELSGQIRAELAFDRAIAEVH